MPETKSTKNQNKQSAKPQTLTDAEIREILLSQNYVSEQDMGSAEKQAAQNKTPLVRELLEEGIITRQLLGQAVAESYNVAFADLGYNQPAREQVLAIPEETAKKLNAVVFQENDTGVIVATDNPHQKQLIANLKKIFPQKEVTLSYALTDDIESAFVHYRKPLDTRFSKILQARSRVAPEIIEEIIEDALVYHASDVHFDPHEKSVVIRFRVDGVLREAGSIPKEFYENVLNRIKVQANLRIDEHFSAQDGAIRYESDGKKTDLRVSIVPTLDGEKVVIRMLGQYVQSFGFADLGLAAADQELVLGASKKPFGMILVTGPTGSGKTTTLYALLKMLNRPELNLMSIEDPVEYKVSGINQIQVNQQTNLTFAKGLRSIVRQDPNIILVGEVRDQETAEIAVNAALTGHLLFSTFHANDAATAVPRLLDMGIEPFLLASTLELVIAQRLVRKICNSCRFSRQVPISELEKRIAGAAAFFGKQTVTLYQGKGCKACSDSGYQGRIAVMELINITREMKELILSNPSTRQVWQLATSQGAHSLFADGIEKVKSGITTLEEVFRVAPPPEKAIR